MNTNTLDRNAPQRSRKQPFTLLRNWFIEYDHSRWDRQIKADSEAGELDFLINEALTKHQAGKTKSL